MFNRCTFALMLSCCCIPMQGHPDSAPELFTADYSLSIGGQSVGKAHRELQQINANTYLFETTADAGVLAHATERSYFTIDAQGKIIPSHYHLERQMLFEHRHTDLSFEWGNGQLKTETERDPQRSFPLTSGTLDKLAVELQIRKDLASTSPKLQYLLADADGIRSYQYTVGDHETLQTAIGTLNTLKIEHSHTPNAPRYTIFWVAPSLNFVPVQVLQQEHGTAFLLKITALHVTKSANSSQTITDSGPQIDLDKLQAPPVPNY